MPEGHISKTFLAGQYDWFNQGFNRYEPNERVLRKLKKYSDRLEFIVIMGGWCSDSREHVPTFYKVVSMLGIPEERITLIAVDRKKAAHGLDLAPYDLTYVPLFIVKYEGREIGRIVEDTKKSMEKDLLELLK